MVQTQFSPESPKPEVLVYRSLQVNHGDPSDETNILFHKPQLL